jgi:hypothetical protein
MPLLYRIWRIPSARYFLRVRILEQPEDLVYSNGYRICLFLHLALQHVTAVDGHMEIVVKVIALLLTGPKLEHAHLLDALLITGVPLTVHAVQQLHLHPLQHHPLHLHPLHVAVVHGQM